MIGLLLITRTTFRVQQFLICRIALLPRPRSPLKCL